MGYYSEIAFVMDKEAHEDFLSAIAKLDDTPRTEVLNLLGMFTKKRYPDGAILYHHPLLKWYVEDFPSVAFVDEFLNDLPERKYRYITIGAEFDDVGEQGCYNIKTGDMYMERRVVIPKGGRKCS